MTESLVGCSARYQVLIAQLLAVHPLHHVHYLVDRVGWSVIESPGELIDIPLQMPDTHVMISTVIAPFQQCPKRLQAVHVGLIAHILADTMVD